MDSLKEIRWNPYGNGYTDAPHEYIQKWRQRGNVLQGPLGYWILLKYIDVSNVLKSDDFKTLELSTFFNEKQEDIFASTGQCPHLAKTSQYWPMHMNGQAHREIRNIIGKAVTSINLDEILEICLNELFSSYQDMKEIDLVKFCSFFQYLIVKKIFGIKDYATFEKVKNYSDTLTRVQELIPRKTYHQINEQIEWGREMFDSSHFKDSVLDQVNKLSFRFDKEELYSLLSVSAIASFETTKDTLAYALYKALDDHKLFEYIEVADKSQLSTYIEEVARLYSPAQYTARFNEKDIELDGQFIPKGSRLILSLVGANRDPDVFESPDELIPTRNPNPHLAFGKGSHFCLGAQMARREISFVLKPMLSFLKEKGLLKIKDVTWGKRIFVRTIDHINIKQA